MSTKSLSVISNSALLTYFIKVKLYCGHMLKGLGLGTVALALVSKVQALALALVLRFWPWLHQCIK